MEVTDVRQILTLIEANKSDDENAHGAEDELHCKVLKEIADGAANAQELAAEALKSLDINFSRWCA